MHKLTGCEIGCKNGCVHNIVVIIFTIIEVVNFYFVFIWVHHELIEHDVNAFKFSAVVSLMGGCAIRLVEFFQICTFYQAWISSYKQIILPSKHSELSLNTKRIQKVSYAFKKYQKYT